MNIQEFLNVSPHKYSTAKKANPLLKKAKQLEQTPEVNFKIKEIELFLKYSKINDFFPTPKPIAEVLANCVDFIYSGFDILEPSAGVGNLADAIKSKYIDYAKNVKLDCIEINYELAEYLKAKGHTVFNCDFLTYETSKKYDLIVMNPPFKDLLKHLNKALELLKTDGQILCIVPTMTSSKNKNFVDKTGAVIYNYNFDFSEVKTGCKCQLLEINRKKIKEFAITLFDFFCRDDNEFNFIERYFSLYLEGSYGYEAYKKINAVKSPSKEHLFEWLTDFLSIEFNFSKTYIFKKLMDYKLFGQKLVDYYQTYNNTIQAIA